jgi:hypothetical protein
MWRQAEHYPIAVGGDPQNRVARQVRLLRSGTSVTKYWMMVVERFRKWDSLVPKLKRSDAQLTPLKTARASSEIMMSCRK